VHPCDPAPLPVSDPYADGGIRPAALSLPPASAARFPRWHFPVALASQVPRARHDRSPSTSAPTSPLLSQELQPVAGPPAGLRLPDASPVALACFSGGCPHAAGEYHPVPRVVRRSALSECAKQ